MRNAAVCCITSFRGIKPECIKTALVPMFGWCRAWLPKTVFVIMGHYPTRPRTTVPCPALPRSARSSSSEDPSAQSRLLSPPACGKLTTEDSHQNQEVPNPQQATGASNYAGGYAPTGLAAPASPCGVHSGTYTEGRRARFEKNGDCLMA